MTDCSVFDWGSFSVFLKPGSEVIVSYRTNLVELFVFPVTWPPALCPFSPAALSDSARVFFSAVISVDRLKKMNFAGAKLPRYQSLRGPRPADLETAVTLPDSVFQPPLDTKGHRHLDVFPESSLRNHSANRKRRHPDDSQQDAVASVIIFHSLASLLPESYDPDKRSLRWEWRMFPLITINLKLV